MKGLERHSSQYTYDTLTERHTMIKVYYKGTEQGQWLLDGEYKTESQAKEVAFDLLLDGYIVSVEQE
jgi:hypothetical protein